ncbi:matrixin family metalloprotease [Sporocytophaga myxococcoides]|uniref:matrixin family metalloprotease n=1 Tax=Sporocytophaga myxococcoides TaxID=153721 RepID=UPI00040A2776|nr:matrixin family metalloprotease [Sporocytophaga myxococcoides]
MKIQLIVFVASILLGCSNDKIVRVGIQPLGNFDSKIVDTISITIQRKYGFKTFILPRASEPQEAFINIKSLRYRADVLIKYLKENKADTLDYIIGLTDYDISVTKRDVFGNVKAPKEKYADWGIFGLGYRPGPSCIISSFRLHSKSKTLYLERLKKVSVHELGHNLGLDHCENTGCVMQDAVESIHTTDKAKLDLCSNCKRELKSWLHQLYSKVVRFQ